MIHDRAAGTGIHCLAVVSLVLAAGYRYRVAATGRASGSPRLRMRSAPVLLLGAPGIAAGREDQDGGVPQRDALQQVSGLDQQVGRVPGMTDDSVGAPGYQAPSGRDEAEGAASRGGREQPAAEMPAHRTRRAAGGGKAITNQVCAIRKTPPIRRWVCR